MPEADLILDNGIVITLDAGSKVAEAIALRGGRIVAVGPSMEVARAAGPRTQRIDLAGRTVLPGFFDAHPHVYRTGLKAGGGTSIAGLRSVAEIIDVVHREARSTPPGAVDRPRRHGASSVSTRGAPRGHGGGTLPQRTTTSMPPRRIIPSTSAASWGWLGLIAPCPSVANSRALADAGVDSRHAGPSRRGDRSRTRGASRPALFLEKGYAPGPRVHAVPRRCPAFTHEDRVEAHPSGASQLYSAAGTTSGFEVHGLTPAAISAYRQIRSRGSLRLRCSHAPVSVPSAVLDDSRLAEYFRHYARVGKEPRLVDEWLRVEGITLGGRGAKRLMGLVGAGYPYDRWAGHFYQSITPGRFLRLGLLAAGLGLRIHRVASRHLEHVLWGYETIDKEVSIRDRRFVAINVTAATPITAGAAPRARRHGNRRARRARDDGFRLGRG